MLVVHPLVLHNMIKNNVFLSDLIPNKHNLEIVTILIMDVEYTYMDIMTGGNCRQLSLLTRNPCIGQFVHPEREEDINVVEGEMLI